MTHSIPSMNAMPWVKIGRTIAHATFDARRFQSFLLKIKSGWLGVLIITSSFINSFAQAPIITGFQFGLPTVATPAYTLYEFWPFPPRWIIHQPAGSNVCRDVRISFTTEVGRRYAVECGALEQPTGWETSWPNLTLNIWRQCSPIIVGTGSVTNWHGGSAYDEQFFRVRQE